MDDVIVALAAIIMFTLKTVFVVWIVMTLSDISSSLKEIKKEMKIK